MCEITSRLFCYCRDVLSMGASRPWQDAVRQMTRGRTNRIDAGAMLKYFEPLNAWLKRQNEMQPVIGWITNRDDKGCFQINICSRISRIILRKCKIYHASIGIFHFVSALFARWYQSSARRIDAWNSFPLLLIACKVFIYL